MKDRRFSLIELLVLIGVIALVAAILFPVYTTGGGPNRSGCLNNLKQLSVAFAQYGQDYNERSPLIVVSPTSTLDNSSTTLYAAYYGWADALFPYVKSVPVFHCPVLHSDNGPPTKFAPLARDHTDYWLNSQIGGVRVSQIKTPAYTLALGEGNDGGDMTDARYSYPALPAPWIADKKSPLYRHLDMAVCCFVDGHVKALKPSEISTGYHNGKFHFAPK